VDMTRDGHAFALEFEMISAALGLEWLWAREILLAQMQQQVEFLLYFELAFYLVDFGEKLGTFGFDQIVGIDRTYPGSREGNQIAQGKLIHQLGNVLFCECCIDRHSGAY